MLIVTGGAGFIGSVLSARLNEAGYVDVVLVDCFGEAEKWRNIANRDFFEIVAIERLWDWLDGFGGRVDAIFHLGAISSTTATDADAVISKNINYSIALWRWCTRAAKPLIYASSAATYGDGTAGFDDDGGIGAFRTLRPLNLYGWSKHAFDLWAMRQAERGEMPPFWAGLKFFNVFGPNEYHKGEMMSLVAKNYGRILAGDHVGLFKSHRPDIADGEQRRDFVYVEDCASVMLWLLHHRSECGIFNLGTGVARSFRDLIEAIGTACGRVPVIEYVDIPQEIRPNYQYFTEANMQKLRRAGYNAPFMPLEDAVHDYVTHYLAKDRYR